MKILRLTRGKNLHFDSFDLQSFLTEPHSGLLMQITMNDQLSNYIITLVLWRIRLFSTIQIPYFRLKSCPVLITHRQLFFSQLYKVGAESADMVQGDDI